MAQVMAVAAALSSGGGALLNKYLLHDAAWPGFAFYFLSTFAICVVVSRGSRRKG